VDQFESQKMVLQQRIDVIETLQRNRTGAQELLQTVAGTVTHVDSLWLTGLNRSGDSLDMIGEAASINAVANFITQLKRTGYFTGVEIKDATENDLLPSVETYSFSMTAAIAGAGPQSVQPKTQLTSAAAPAPGSAKGASSHAY
jgi:type IV pilus assembly protein PilN